MSNRTEEGLGREGLGEFGVILRSYAKNSEEVPAVVARAVRSIKHIWSVRDKNDRHIFKSVVVVVPKDYDCGLTAKAVRMALPPYDPFFEFNSMVIEPKGHHSCEALNEGVSVLYEQGIDYVEIVSNKAIGAMTHANCYLMLEAFRRGAKVVGVATDELADIVKAGRVQNTFAGWEVKALLEVGGFDSQTGVEEIAPSVRLIQKYGPCIGVIAPAEMPALDIRKSADGVARHNEVMTTKNSRQCDECDRMGVDFEFIKQGILVRYPEQESPAPYW